MIEKMKNCGKKVNFLSKKCVHDEEISVFQIQLSRFLFNLNMLLILVYKTNIFKIITICPITFEKHKHIFFLLFLLFNYVLVCIKIQFHIL